MYENNIFDMLKAGDCVVVAGHTSPDGDAVGAALGLALALNQKGVKVNVLLEEYAERFDFIQGKEFIYKGDYSMLSPKIFFAVDCGDTERLGRAAEVFNKAEVTYNIDHHISNTSFAQYNIVNPKASSASEIVYEIVKDKCQVTVDMATALYSGLVFDTSGFKHNSTSRSTHIAAGEMVELGVDTAFIHSKILYEHSLSQFKVMRTALNNVHLIENGDIIYTVITKEELDRCGAKNGDTDGVAEYLLNLRGVKVSALITQREENKVKISLRSKKYNVNKVASAFGGGGHILAAGATSFLPLEQTVNTLIDRIKEEITNEEQQ